MEKITPEFDFNETLYSYFNPEDPKKAQARVVLMNSLVNSTSDTITNQTINEAPTFDSDSLNVVIIYCVLFVIASIGNLTVFIALFTSRRKSRVSMMIAHLSLADLVVTFVMIPLEVGWRITVKWMAGNVACKTFLLLRAFGLYSSSNILVCISIDRYFAVMYPLKVADARRRGRLMLAFAWSFSFICSIPQSFVFHVSPHPTSPDFEQCVSFGYFSSRKYEIAYSVFGLLAMYFLPLVIICVMYCCILMEIHKNSRENRDINNQRQGARVQLRRSDIRNIERARSRTLKMTITIVSVFAWCWLPYTIMTMWYMIDLDSAQKVDSRIQDFFFIMAVSNSCVNPIVYGGFVLDFKKLKQYFCRCCSGRPITRSLGSGTFRSNYTGRRLQHVIGENVRSARIENSPPSPTRLTSENGYCPIHSDPIPQSRDFRQTSCTLATTRSLETSLSTCRGSTTLSRNI